MGQSEKIMSIFDEYNHSAVARQETQTQKNSLIQQTSQGQKPIKKVIRRPKIDPKKSKIVYYKDLRKITKKYYKELRKQTKKKIVDQKRLAKKKEEKVEKMSKKISRAVDKKLKKEYKLKDQDNIRYLRLTEPKEKRNLLSRIRNRVRYDKGGFDYIEENIQNGYITPETIASGEVTKREWKELQRYEDAREDVSIKKGWGRFKAILAAVAISASLIACKTVYDDVKENLERGAVQAQELKEKNELEAMERHAKVALFNFTDQQLLYEYTNGQPTVENWEALPDNVQEYIRNPVTAAEAAYKYGNDQSNFYVMTGGNLTTEAWEKLPDEIRQFVREPVSTAKEYFENGRDQRYLYEVSRGMMTEEFWQGLPDEIKQYVRNPIELAKEFERNGDYLGYLANLSEITDTTQLSREVWGFLPEELKAHIVDPKLVISLDELQHGIDSATQNTQDGEDIER